MLRACHPISSIKFLFLLKVLRRRNTEVDFNSWTKHFVTGSADEDNHVAEDGSIIGWFLRNKTDCDKLSQGQGSLLSDALKLMSILGLYVCIRKIERFIK